MNGFIYFLALFVFIKFEISFSSSIQRHVKEKYLRGSKPRENHASEDLKKRRLTDNAFKNLKRDKNNYVLGENTQKSNNEKRNFRKQLPNDFNFDQTNQDQNNFEQITDINSQELRRQVPNNLKIEELFNNGNDQDVVTKDTEKDIFIFLPDHENTCYYKDMDEDDDDEEDDDMNEKQADKWRVSKLMGRIKQGDNDSQKCQKHGPHYVDEFMQTPLHSACGQRPILHIDQLACHKQRYPQDFDHISSVYYKFKGKKCMCKFFSRTVAMKSCSSWTSGWWRIKTQSKVCIWSYQYFSQLTCRKDVSRFQSVKKYFVVK